MPGQEEAFREVVRAVPVGHAVLPGLLEEAAVVAADGVRDLLDLLPGLAQGPHLLVGEQRSVLAVQDVVALRPLDVYGVSAVSRHGAPPSGGQQVIAIVAPAGCGVDPRCDA